MARIHDADLRPGKLELLAGWLARCSWFDGEPSGDLEQVGAFRFDDPDGRVGIETFLLRDGTDGGLLQVPVTYRDAPLEGAGDSLVGTMHHSVLGKRWVYDGCADPVAVAALVRAVLTGATGAAHEQEVDGVLTPMEPTAAVVGSGTADRAPSGIGFVSAATDGSVTMVDAGSASVEVLHRPVVDPPPDGAEVLTVVRPAAHAGRVLAAVRPA